MLAAVQLRVLGGAYARVPADATAYAHRSSRIMVNVGVYYLPDADPSVQHAWVDNTIAGLRQDDRGEYVNFMAGEGADGLRAAYPEPTLSRLRQIKLRCDRDNVSI
jgi:hypothetical protein